MWSLSSKGSRPEEKPRHTRWQGAIQRLWCRYQSSYLGGNASAGIWGKSRTSQSWSKYWSRKGWGGWISGSVGNALHTCAKKKAIDHLGSLGIPVSVSGFLCQDPWSPCRIPFLSLKKWPIWRINSKNHGREDTQATKSSMCTFQGGKCQERKSPQQLNKSET